MDEQDLLNRFTYHAPKGDQNEKYEALRKYAYEFALMINVLVPESREKSLAITNLEIAVMFANAGISRHE